MYLLCTATFVLYGFSSFVIKELSILNGEPFEEVHSHNATINKNKASHDFGCSSAVC